jgi:uncharacterized protein (TIGR02099 family)
VFRRHVNFAFRLTARVYRLLTVVVALAGLVFALLILGLRFFVLPNIDRWRPEIEAAASAAAGQTITIAAVNGSWSGARPWLELRGVVVHDAAGRPAFELAHAQAAIALRSLLLGSFRLHQLVVDEPRLTVRRDARGSLFVAGFPVQASSGDSHLMEWLLRQAVVEVRDATVTWIDERRAAPPLALTQLNLRLEGGGSRTRFGLSLRPPASLGLPLQVRGDLRRPRTGAARSQWWSGRLYLRAPYFNLGDVRSWMDLPARIDSGAGDLEAWIDLDDNGLDQATVDLRLAGLSLGLSGDLPVLALRAMQGRLHWLRRDGGFEVQARRLSILPLDGELLPEANLMLRRAAAEEPAGGTVIEADQLDLAVLAGVLPALPVSQELRGLVGALAPAGRVEALAVRIPDHPHPEGPGVEINGRLRGVSIAPGEHWPGMTGLSGRVRTDAKGGRLELDCAPMAFTWSRVFADPLRLDRLQVAAEWTRLNGATSFTVSRLVAMNADFTATAAGTWTSSPDGPGAIDLSAEIPVLAATAVPRYLPVQMGASTRGWLSDALKDGVARDVRLVLKGDLHRFPFAAPGSGKFEVTAGVEKGKLAFAPGWPLLEDVKGTLAFRGQGMTIDASGRTLGLRIGRATVTIADLAHRDAVLQVRGEAKAAVPEALRYMESSPVGGWIGNVAKGATGEGAGWLSLELDLPLERLRDARVRGTFAMADAALSGARFIPDLSGVNGRLQFTEAGATIRDGVANLYGMPVRLSLTAAPGGVSVSGTGRVRAEVARKRFAVPWLRYVEGETDWRGTLSVRRGRTEFQFDSDLDGMALRLPAPFDKPAAARLPLRVQQRARGAEDVLLLSLRNRMEAALLLDGSGSGFAVRGGALLLGAGSAPRPPAKDGLYVTAALDRIDLDPWREVLVAMGAQGEDGAPSSGAASPALALAGVDARAGAVTILGRTLDSVSLSLQRQDSVWEGKIDSRQVRGELSWDTAGRGRFAARLSQLHLPATAPGQSPGAEEIVEGRALPALDVSADSFHMGARDFGRLTLQAVPNGPGWQMEKLDLIAPEGSIRAKGGWQSVRGAPLSQFTVKVETSDIGAYFRRLALPEGVVGGQATLEGPLEWRGNPYALHIPSLSGQLRLDAQKGQFTRVEPGIGKLLGVLSLQSLPRRVSLDFRDIFSQGFAFDRITGQMTFSKGVVHTEDLKMVGSAAKVAMSGEVDLGQETQTLSVRVVPSISDSLALGTAIVNPAVGLATLIVGRVLNNPIDEAAAFEYRVTGSLADPKVERVQRPQPEGGQGQGPGTKMRR